MFSFYCLGKFIYICTVIIIIPRNYRRKSERGIAKPDEMLRAVRHIKSTGKSMQKTAESFGINYKTLSRYIKKFSGEEINIEDSFPTTTVGYTRNRQVFTDAQEIMIVKYFLKASDIYFGLSPKNAENLLTDLLKLTVSKYRKVGMTNNKLVLFGLHLS